MCWHERAWCPVAQVMLDANGALVDMLFCAQLSGNIRRSREGDNVFADPRKLPCPVPSPSATHPVPSHAQMRCPTGDSPMFRIQDNPYTPYHKEYPHTTLCGV